MSARDVFPEPPYDKADEVDLTTEERKRFAGYVHETSRDPGSQALARMLLRACGPRRRR